MDITSTNHGISGTYDKAMNKTFKYGTKVVIDLGLVSCMLYFTVEAVKKMRHVNDHRNGGTDHDEKHRTVLGHWDAILTLLVCVLLFFLVAFDLIMSCHSFVTHIVSCHTHEIGTLDQNNPRIIVQA